MVLRLIVEGSNGNASLQFISVQTITSVMPLKEQRRTEETLLLNFPTSAPDLFISVEFPPGGSLIVRDLIAEQGHAHITYVKNVPHFVFFLLIFMHCQIFLRFTYVLVAH